MQLNAFPRCRSVNCAIFYAVGASIGATQVPVEVHAAQSVCISRWLIVAGQRRLQSTLCTRHSLTEESGWPITAMHRATFIECLMIS